MKKAYIQDLLHKYEKGICTPDETVALQQWLDGIAAAANEHVFEAESKEQVRRKLLQSVLRQGTGGKAALVRMRLTRLVAAAAVLAAVITACWWWAQPRLLTEKASAQVRRVVLPDGSVVWLNKNSAIAYSSAFTRNRYLVLEKGEAFFEVKKDTAYPFVIKSDEVYTTVKGTSFSVRKDFYTNDAVVSVLTGRVAVSHQADTMAVLVPGRRLRYVKEMQLYMEDSVAPGEVNGWIEGETILQRASVHDVADWLHTSFGVNVQNRNTRYNGNYYLSFKKGITLQEALRIINLVSSKQNVHFSLHNNEVVIE